MKPAPPEPADLVPRLRQQLILAQVRIMELEDVRESLVPRLAETEKLLAQAQTLADQKTEEAAHLAQVLAGLQGQLAHLQQAHHLAAQDLVATRAVVAETSAQLARQSATAAQFESSLRQAETELKNLKASRSWRWTAWLRTLGGK